MDFNQLSSEIYAQNKAVGWWDNPNRCLYECLQLVSTEVAEATEGARKSLMDDKLPHRVMEEVELADALVRVLDLGGHMGWEYRPGASYPVGISEWSTGRQHLYINEAVISLAQNMFFPIRAYSDLIERIVWVAEVKAYDLESAMVEKLAFNKTRPDHQRENRAQTHGKKF